MEKVRIAAGIVLYNPDIERLRQNISAIAPQVDCLLIVDNASANRAVILQLLQEIGMDANSPFILCNEENRGIAHALNQLMQLGRTHGMDWVLTLDQDSVCPSDIISQFVPYANSLTNAGILSPVIQDRSFGIEHRHKADEAVTMVNECITSASLTRVKAWEEVGGFDDALFIDAVDTDYCLTLHEHGWKVARINSVELQHEIGQHATQHIIGGRSYIAFNHAPWRYFYMSRNMVYLSRKHKGFLKPAPWRCILTMIARMGVILCWENDGRIVKCRQIIRGIHAGCRMPLTLN